MFLLTDEMRHRYTKTLRVQTPEGNQRVQQMTLFCSLTSQAVTKALQEWPPLGDSVTKSEATRPSDRAD